MLKFLFYLILFFVLVRMIARFFIGRFIAKHMPKNMGAPPPSPGTGFSQIKDAEFEDITDSK